MIQMRSHRIYAVRSSPVVGEEEEKYEKDNSGNER